MKKKEQEKEKEIKRNVTTGIKKFKLRESGYRSGTSRMQ